MAAEYVWETPEKMDLLLAQQIRRIRKRRSVSKEKLSQLNGVSFLRRQERFPCCP